MNDLIDFGITPTTASLGRLIELYGGQGLHIPPYQRGYEWNARNIQRFIDTLLEEFKKSAGEPNPVFLGSIQISEEKGKEGAATASIVDGRQRLTTLALLEAFLIYKGEEKSEASVASLLSEQDDPDLVSIIKKFEDDEIESYAVLSNRNPSVLRLTRKAKKEANECKNIYERNARFIATILKNINDESKGFLDYLKRNVFFIVVAVKNRDLTSIIKIFDSMNSTGQPLSDEAMFKLRLYAHVRSLENDKEPSEIMGHINETYKLVEDYNENHNVKIYMPDVLWGFRLFCVANKNGIIHEKESLDEVKAETFLMPTLQFFEMLFSLSGVEVTLDLFREYTESHIRFYEDAYGDTSWTQDNRKAFYYSLQDYFGYTRYSSFWALPLVCFALRKGSVLTALQDCEPVFEACLAWSICYDKANKRFRTTFLYQTLDYISSGKSLKDIAVGKIKEIDPNRKFWDEVEKDIYDSYRQAYLLLAILGMQEEINAGKTFGDALSLYFPAFGEEPRPQIEHIYAKSKWDKNGSGELKSRLNGLGNLVPLEAKINQGDNKDELPSVKFDSGKFFDKSKTIQSVKTLISLYHSVHSHGVNLDDPEVWEMEVVRPRFTAAKDTLIDLMDLLKF